MTDYSKIKNKRLLFLVLNSESIQSLPENERSELVENISFLPEEGQRKMIEALEEEQQKIALIKKEKGITEEMDAKKIKEKVAKIKLIKKNLKNVEREEKEKIETVKDESEAMNILSKI